MCTSAKSFGHHSHISLGIADGVIAGLGIQGYEMALHCLVRSWPGRFSCSLLL